ncbi:MAG: hypothetical protein L6R42_006792 [Xanthoria sp. 1 TBL-2021]|nr:MAG: hypothetical protein L6R42_006792 [Xanthoria sp. 1 TBL-2021]
MSSSSDPCAPTQAIDSPQRLYAEIEASGAQTDNGPDILHIIPLNTEARRAFDTVAQAANQGTLAPLHAQYVCVTGSRPLVDHAKDVTSARDGRDPPATVLTGHYRLSFSLMAVLKAPLWVVGRGSKTRFESTRNVDILLVAPDTTGYSNLAAAHLYLGIHSKSGAWRIKAGAEITVDDEDYQQDEEVYLRRPKTRIELLDMQYMIQFKVNTPELEDEYLKARNASLLREGYPLPHTGISGIPIQGDTDFDSIVFRHGLGSGSFGSVYEGYSPANGKLRVAKRIILQSAHRREEVDLEIQALQRFKGCLGIIELVDWRTALNGRNLLVSHYPLDVYLIHEKGVVFNKFDWSTVSWDIKRSLCYQLLMGLKTIHNAGCMHRDITPMNILVFPNEEPHQAVLCDFGKFCDTPTEVETRLAGWLYLPPELEKDKRNLYNEKLDIWMLGLALTHSWWPQTNSRQPRKTDDFVHIKRILLENKASNGLSVLIARMMEWQPQERPSAADALKDETMQQYAAGQAHGMASTSTSKRPYSSTDR